MKKFYIFDLDGTLCDSMEYWREETAMIKNWSDRKALEPCYRRMREHYRSDVGIKDGVMEFIQAAGRQGVRMCIASATQRELSQPFLEKTGLMDYMEFYIDCDEIHAYKERPDIYLKAAERLGADISECVVFEDAEYCINTARSAGFYVVGVYDAVADREGVPQKACDRFIRSWNSAAELLLPDK